jgi:hypothetical protein
MRAVAQYLQETVCDDEGVVALSLLWLGQLKRQLDGFGYIWQLGGGEVTTGMRVRRCAEGCANKLRGRAGEDGPGEDHGEGELREREIGLTRTAVGTSSAS